MQIPPMYAIFGSDKMLLVTSYELQVTSYKLRVTSYELRATSYELRATSYELRATSYEWACGYKRSEDVPDGHTLALVYG